MENWRINTAMRFFFLVIAVVLWLGIWLTGFEQAHWLLYVPAIFLALAALTGFCPGLFFSRSLLGKG